MIAWLFGKFKGWLIGAGVALAAIGAAYLRGRSSGAQDERDEAMRRNVDAWEKADDARARADRESHGDSLRDDDGFRRD